MRGRLSNRGAMFSYVSLEDRTCRGRRRARRWMGGRRGREGDQTLLKVRKRIEGAFWLKTVGAGARRASLGGQSWRERRFCKRCGHRFRWRSVWSASRMSDATTHELLRRFVWGVPVYRQRFGALVSAPAIECFYRRVRACMAWAEEFREPFAGAVEWDETTFGGTRHGKRGWGAAGKVIVFSIVKRNGQVKAMPIAAHRRAEGMRPIQAHTREGALYSTDEWHAYATLKLRGEHVVIRKEKGKPVGRDPINGIEGFWSYAKNGLYSYRGVPRKYFHLYLGEVCYRFNHRTEDLKPLLVKLLKTTSIQNISPKLVQSR